MSRRSLRTAAVLIALGLVAAACGGSDGGSTTSTTSVDGANPFDGTTTESTFDLDQQALPTATPDGSTTPTPTTTAGTTPDDGLVDPDTIPANRWGAPKPGRYSYEISDRGDRALFDVADTVESEEQARSFDRTGDLNQLQAFTTTQQSVSRLIRWEPGGGFLIAEQRKLPDGSESAVCVFEPRVTWWPRPLTMGTTWTSTGTCTAEGFTRTRTTTGEVTGTETVTVDGVTLEVLVIHRVTDTATGGNGVDVGEHEDVTERYAPSVGLIVAVEGTHTNTIAGVPKDPSTITRRLLSTRGQARR